MKLADVRYAGLEPRRAAFRSLLYYDLAAEPIGVEFWMLTGHGLPRAGLNLDIAGIDDANPVNLQTLQTWGA